MDIYNRTCCNSVTAIDGYQAGIQRQGWWGAAFGVSVRQCLTGLNHGWCDHLIIFLIVQLYYLFTVSIVINVYRNLLLSDSINSTVRGKWNFSGYNVILRHQTFTGMLLFYLDFRFKIIGITYFCKDKSSAVKWCMIWSGVRLLIEENFKELQFN